MTFHGVGMDFFWNYPALYSFFIVCRYANDCMGFTPEMERDFVKKDLGPTLAKFGYSDLKLMMLDDNRPNVKKWVNTMLSDNQTAKYISGIAVHWYEEQYTSPHVLTAAHKKLVWSFDRHYISIVKYKILCRGIRRVVHCYLASSGCCSFVWGTSFKSLN